MSRRTQKNVGIVGLGIIGRRVADNLRRRGFSVFVWNRTPRPYPNFVGSPAEVAELCDFVQIFVSDDEALLQMVQQMKSALHVQHVIIAHSTVAPHTMRNAAEIVQRRGAQFLDAPFTGSKIPAEKGELVYYVAGDEAAYRRARPVLEASSKEIIEIGEIGQATTVKIATNMITAATVQAAAEALALVHHADLPPEKFTAALRGNASNSGTLSIKLPKMIEGDFDPHFSVKHMLKDVQIAARMARSYGLTLGATEAARDSLLEEANSGRGDDDFSSLVRTLFPEGLPSERRAEEEDDAQQTLDGVEEQAATQARREERAAREAEAAAAPPDAGEPRETAPEEDDEDENVREAATAADKAVEAPEVEHAESPGEHAPEATAAAHEEEPARGRAELDERADEAREAEEEAARQDIANPASDEVFAEREDEQPVRDEEDERDRDGTPSSDGDAEDQQARVTGDESDVPADERDDVERGQAPIAEEPPDADPEPETKERAEEEEVAKPPTVVRTTLASRVIAHGDYEIGGEPPRERPPRENREPAPPEPSPPRDEVAARRSFLSRMFGRGEDY